MFRRPAPIIRSFLVYACGALLFGSGLSADFSADWAKMKRIQPKGYVCYRAVEPIDVDGKLDETSWQNVPWTEFFVDIEGATKPPPPLQTLTAN